MLARKGLNVNVSYRLMEANGCQIRCSTLKNWSNVLPRFSLSIVFSGGGQSGSCEMIASCQIPCVRLKIWSTAVPIVTSELKFLRKQLGREVHFAGFKRQLD